MVPPSVTPVAQEFLLNASPAPGPSGLQFPVTQSRQQQQQQLPSKPRHVLHQENGQASMPELDLNAKIDAAIDAAIPFGHRQSGMTALPSPATTKPVGAGSEPNNGNGNYNNRGHKSDLVPQRQPEPPTRMTTPTSSTSEKSASAFPASRSLLGDGSNGPKRSIFR